MNTLEVLQAAREKLRNGERYQAKHLAVDANGEVCPPCSPAARKWSAAGACWCAAEGDGALAGAAQDALKKAAGGVYIDDYAARRKFAEVRAVFDAAVAEVGGAA